jgi:hypothetical protein
MSDGRHVAVADSINKRVSVFSVGGDFVRHVGVGVLGGTMGVASTAFDELVVADGGTCCVFVFSSSGEVLKTMGRAEFTGVAIHGGTVFAHGYESQDCVVFT